MRRAGKSYRNRAHNLMPVRGLVGITWGEAVPGRKKVAGAVVVMSFLLLAPSLLPAPGVASPVAATPGRSCSPGSIIDSGPASLAAPIVTGQIIGGNAFTVSRGLQPVLVGELDLATRNVTRVLELPTGSGAWASTVASGTLYVGTYGPAHLYQVDPSGSPERVAEFPREQFIWDAAAAPDDSIYLGTYPTASVYRYDTSTGTVQTYGSVAPGELYVRSIGYFGGKVYAGIGSRAGLVALDAETGDRAELLPPELEDESFVYDLEVSSEVIVAGTDPSGFLAVIDRNDPSQYEIVETGTKTVDAIAIAGDTIYFTTRTAGTLFAYDRNTGQLEDLGIPSPGEETRELFVRDGTLVGFAGSGAVWNYDLASGDVILIDLQEAGHPAAPEPPQSITTAGGAVHVGGHWQVTRHDARSGKAFRARIPGEPKAMVEARGKVYAALYPSAQVWAYDADDPEPVAHQIASIHEEQERPRDIAYNPRTRTIAIGTQPHYGRLGGALALLNVESHELQTFRNVIQDQSVSAVDTRGASGTIYVGSEIRGGIGVPPVAREAHLGAWDPSTQQNVWEVAPVSGAPEIYDIQLAGGRLVGVTSGGQAFSIDPTSGEVLARAAFDGATELRRAGDTLYGVDRNRVYTINPKTLERAVLYEGLSSQWYTGPHLAPDDVCGIYALRRLSLIRVGTNPHMRP